MRHASLVSCIVALLAATAQADMRITEWMYKGHNNEFVEFTNLGSTTVNMTGWSYSDSSRVAGHVDLSAFGDVAPGESVILAELDAEAFRTAWNLSSSVKIIGPNAIDNLGNGDEINLYSSGSTTAVDTLTYGKTGNVLTDSFSGNPGSSSDVGANHAAGWVLSYVGDTFGSHVSTGGDVGNPGIYVVPEPTMMVLGLIGLVSLIGLRRRWM